MTIFAFLWSRTFFYPFDWLVLLQCELSINKKSVSHKFCWGSGISHTCKIPHPLCYWCSSSLQTSPVHVNSISLGDNCWIKLCQPPIIWYLLYSPLLLILFLPLLPISELRYTCNQMAIHDMVLYLNGCNDGVAIFDATNHTQARRADLVEKVENSFYCALLLIQSFSSW